MGNPVVHFEVVGRDPEALWEFYRQMFGWSVEADNEYGYGMVDTRSDAGIGGGIGAGPDPEHSHVTFYVEVADVAAALDEAVKLGGSVVMPAADMGEVVVGLFADPGGHVIGVLTSKDAGSHGPSGQFD